MTATRCGWCTAYATMTPVTDGQAGYLIEPGVLTYWVQAAFRCHHCQKLSIGETIIEGGFNVPSVSSNDWDWWDDKAISWAPKKPIGQEFPDTPNHIGLAADEAFRCRDFNSLRSSILLARSVIEAICKDCGVTDGRLAEKIDRMAEKQLIRPYTQEAAHELRFLGNDMAHGDFVVSPTENDADAVVEIMAEMLNEVYQGPARVQRMRQKRRGTK